MSGRATHLAVCAVALCSALLTIVASPGRAHAQTLAGPVALATTRGAEQAAHKARLHAVEAELSALRPDVIRVRRAKVMTIVGFAAAAAFTVLGPTIWGLQNLCVDNCDDYSSGPSMGRIYQWLLAPITVSFTVGIAGAVLVRRRKRELGPRIQRYRDLKLERHALILKSRTS